ncbi:MAG: imidazole glycerol phosphate synthase subunit HisH [Gemmatimonadetes bacterium]|nr:imidazole glycerol phosphate synthase subunit HisH [Gemmatimonadota bacterium]
MKSVTAAVIDYGAGNLGNARRAIEELGFPLKLVREPSDVSADGTVLLPGVGNYGAAMETINHSGVADAIREAARSGRRVIGICLGLQMLFSTSEEAPGIPGLGILAGRVRRLHSGGRPLPHLGWGPVGTRGTPLYFAHSFVVDPEDRSTIKATAEWGETFPALVENGSVVGFQFHPERSGDPGLELLRAALNGQPLNL